MRKVAVNTGEALSRFTRVVRMRVAPFVALSLFVSGCGTASITSLGNDILRGVGLGGESVVFKPEQSLTDAAVDPSPENEYYLGRAVAAKLLGLYEVESDPALEEYLSYALSVVSAASERPVLFKGYRVIIIDTDEVNAMSAPGGFVLISVGMLRRLTSEDELAAVLAHEVAHIEQRHGIKALTREKLDSSVAALGVVASSLYCGQVVQQALAVLGATVSDMVDTLTTKGYSRELEHEADLRAVAILARAGYDPAALAGALRDVEKPDHNFSGGWFATHPSTSERLVRVEGRIKDMAGGSSLAARRVRFETAFRRLRKIRPL